ncbi:hypothetical protein C8Q74DRAFT_1216402 [Fomes fomentarius]|nr:hypothetical protein C8Q74DRAFT_1216402 [Fomes fomentarius]
MFKRVEKRIRKKEKEEELGLDGDMKEMLGMNDTDSDESSAGSDSEDSAGEEARGLPSPEDENVSDAEEDVDGDDAEEEDGEESEEEEDEGPSMTVSEALRDPLYLISREPEVKCCILCPGKLLKNSTMIEVHLKSGAHTRHFAHLRESAMDVDADTDVRDLMRAQLVRKAEGQRLPIEGKLSKRAQKKKAKLAAIKAKREKQKIMKAKYRAKKDAKLQTAAAAQEASDTSDAESDRPAKPPPAKKRKVQQKQSAASNSDTDDDLPPAPAKLTQAVKPSKKSEPTPKPNAKALTKSLTTAKPTPIKPSKATLSSPVKAKKRRRSGQV